MVYKCVYMLYILPHNKIGCIINRLFLMRQNLQFKWGNHHYFLAEILGYNCSRSIIKFQKVKTPGFYLLPFFSDKNCWLRRWPDLSYPCVRNQYFKTDSSSKRCYVLSVSRSPCIKCKNIQTWRQTLNVRSILRFWYDGEVFSKLWPSTLTQVPVFCSFFLVDFHQQKL